MNYGHWETTSSFLPDDHFGFIYIVEHKDNGMRYIGKKQFRTKLTRKPLKGKKRKRIDYVPSKWETYTTSSEIINKIVKDEGTDAFHWHIVLKCDSKASLSYSETNLQHKLDVLTARDYGGNRVWYNNQIAAVKFQIDDGLDIMRDQVVDKFKVKKPPTE